MIGLINGFGFVVIYAVLGVPIARLSDRGSYGQLEQDRFARGWRGSGGWGGGDFRGGGGRFR